MNFCLPYHFNTPLIVSFFHASLLWAAILILPYNVGAQVNGELMPIEFENSAEYRWLQKEVLDSRLLDDMSEPGNWTLTGTGDLTFQKNSGPDGMNTLRVEMEMFSDQPAPTTRRLSSVNLVRKIPDENWNSFNRISMWIRPDVKGFPMLPLQIVLHNDGEVKVPDAYYREGIHYVTLQNKKWQKVVWEITPTERDKVTSLEFGYWVNKMLAAPDDRISFEMGQIELQRVEPDHYKGWDVAPGKISYSHTGYQVGASKSALASDLSANNFQLIRLDNNSLPELVLDAPIETVTTKLGEYQLMDFSEVRKSGTYIIQAGNTRTQPFKIDEDVWRGTIWKTLNFFYGQRCGYKIPGSHDVCHTDWMATQGNKKIVMNGGWHDAGDLSQGMINTGEATYSMFALAEKLQKRKYDPELLERVLDEAKWGLHWILKVRFEGGFRIGFASNNLWTNGIIGDEDDRTREALNNPNVNYIAASAAAIASRVLKHIDPQLAAKSLRIAEDDWQYAINGTAGPETWSTPAYSTTPLELAGIGILASIELYKATGKKKYADKATELGQIIVDSQQKRFVGPEFPLAGFFYTGPDKEDHFYQFHHGNDQAPILAMAKLVSTFPFHENWMDWYAVIALYSEYQKTSSQITEPYGVLPAYVYHESDYIHFPEQAARHQASREGFRDQVLQGLPMGDGYYLRKFPVWFSRRGNYGVLLSQAKALAIAAHTRRNLDAANLAQKQAQWIVGRNPFASSTMYGEGYDWSQIYSVSSGDFVGSLPVGMKSYDITDVPYWPPQNMYVYKEVWTHSTSRWLWLMEELSGPAIVEGRVTPSSAHQVEIEEKATGRTLTIDVDNDGSFRSFIPEGEYLARAHDKQTSFTALTGSRSQLDLRKNHSLDFTLEKETTEKGAVTIKLTATGEGTHTFTLRSDNLDVNQPEKELTLTSNNGGSIEWNAQILSADAPWVAVVIPNGNISLRKEVVGSFIRNE
ncbi:MAG: glycoside hydrolase family 9 protein [Balneolaceae bacterium]|nr:glycoside hydrolase family 9 protein [Balneolaceae bacterium]MDR9408206.1 glycoside hydrolase family 9 protein [Balneolaceae bacterium]